MAANTSLLRGSSAVLQLATRDIPAGQLGGAIFNDEYSISTVGRITGVEIRVNTDLEAFHEIGTRLAQDLVPGNINISGRADRAFINGALLRLLLGNLAADGQGEGGFKAELQPTFNMIVDMTDIRQNTVGTKITLFDVLFDDWEFIVPEDDFLRENITFKALRIQREEKA
jgi:hypothetical protein